LVTAAGMDSRDKFLLWEKFVCCAKNNAQKIDIQKCGEETRYRRRNSHTRTPSDSKTSGSYGAAGTSHCARDSRAFSTRSTALHQSAALHCAVAARRFSDTAVSRLFPRIFIQPTTPPDGGPSNGRSLLVDKNSGQNQGRNHPESVRLPVRDGKQDTWTIWPGQAH
jgi:hypothetical protein